MNKVNKQDKQIWNQTTIRRLNNSIFKPEIRKENLMNLLHTDRLPTVGSQMALDIRNSLLDVIYSSKSETDIEFLIKCIEK